jgi:hypothetical protein
MSAFVRTARACGRVGPTAELRLGPPGTNAGGPNLRRR